MTIVPFIGDLGPYDYPTLRLPPKGLKLVPADLLKMSQDSTGHGDTKRVNYGERRTEEASQSNSEPCTSSQGDDPAFSSDAEFSYEHVEEERKEFSKTCDEEENQLTDEVPDMFSRMQLS